MIEILICWSSLLAAVMTINYPTDIDFFLLDSLLKPTISKTVSIDVRLGLHPIQYNIKAVISCLLRVGSPWPLGTCDIF